MEQQRKNLGIKNYFNLDYCTADISAFLISTHLGNYFALIWLTSPEGLVCAVQCKVFQ